MHNLITAVALAAITQSKHRLEDKPDVKRSLPYDMYVEEHRTARIQLPRASGHTTAMGELLRIIPGSVGVVYTNVQLVAIARATSHRRPLFTYYQIRDGELRGHLPENFRVVIVDGISRWRQNEIDLLKNEVKPFDPFFLFLG
jgi:hypothetical protein